MEAQTTVSNSTQCGLFLGEYKKYRLSGVTFSFESQEKQVHNILMYFETSQLKSETNAA